MQRTLTAFGVAILIGWVTASTSWAQVTFELIDVPIPPGTQIVDGFFIFEGVSGPVLGNLDDYVCQDLAVDTASDWIAAVMVLDLTSGSIHQELEGFVVENGRVKAYNGQSYKEPDPSFFIVLPSSEFDTYLHGNGQQVTPQGAAGDVGGDAMQFDATQIDITWSGPSWVKDDIGINFIGRITLTDDATGTWKLKVTQAGDSASNYVVTGTIADGVLAFDP